VTVENVPARHRVMLLNYRVMLLNY
jgi:hypothetical protein